MKKLVGISALVIGLIAPTSAGAVTANIGEPSGTHPGIACAMNCSYFQESVAPGSTPYVVPAAPATGPWTITSWSATGDGGGYASLELWRPTGVSGQFRLVAKSASGSIPGYTTPVIPASIPALPGDVLGLHGDDGGVTVEYLAPGSTAHIVAADAAVGETSGTPSSTWPGLSDPSYRVNVGATLTAPDPPVAAKRKCKKKKKKHASAAKKKKCKKKKKHASAASFALHRDL
jgi:hypothetical protein